MNSTSAKGIREILWATSCARSHSAHKTLAHTQIVFILFALWFRFSPMMINNSGSGTQTMRCFADKGSFVGKGARRKRAREKIWKRQNSIYFIFHKSKSIVNQKWWNCVEYIHTQTHKRVQTNAGPSQREDGYFTAKFNYCNLGKKKISQARERAKDKGLWKYRAKAWLAAQILYIWAT